MADRSIIPDSSSLMPPPLGFEQEMGIDYDLLLKPISSEEPSGRSLRYDLVYDQIREARREDRTDLSRGVWEHELKRADWEQVRELCLDVLAHRSKDLQICAWLAEALTHIHGFRGAAAGLTALARIGEAFWATVHPRIRGDDLEYRVAPFRWLNNNLVPVLRKLPISDPAVDDRQAMTWADWMQAEYVEERGLSGKQSVLAPGTVTGADFMSSVSVTPLSFYSRLRRELALTNDAVERFNIWRGGRFGDTAPALYDQLRATIQTLFKFVDKLFKEKGGIVHMAGADDDEFVPRRSIGAAAATGEGEEGGGSDDGADGDEASGELNGALALRRHIRNREEAYRQLNDAAEFLIRAEPHSPVPYLVKRAVAWGGLSLDELFQELMQYQQGRLTIFDLLRLNVHDQRDRD